MAIPFPNRDGLSSFVHVISLGCNDIEEYWETAESEAGSRISTGTVFHSMRKNVIVFDKKEFELGT
jgi:hypothetical protein